jgi:uncharacterized delta-60 repeat protein
MKTKSDSKSVSYAKAPRHKARISAKFTHLHFPSARRLVALALILQRVVALAAVLRLISASAFGQSGAEIWVQRHHGPSSGAAAYALAVDHASNVVVAGSISGINSWADFGTIKYSSAGIPLWTNYYNGPSNDMDTAYAIVIDTNNNVVVTGSSIGNGYRPDGATVKYSGAGVPLWTNRYDRAGQYDAISAITADAGGNVYVVGYSEGADYLANYVTIKYSSAGAALWTKIYDGPGYYDYGNDIEVDSGGNVYVTGESQGSGSDYDFATLKYSSAGVPLWTNRYNGPGNSDDRGKALALDASGNVYVTGLSYADATYTNSDFLTIKYSSAGVPLWTNRYNGLANGRDQAVDLAVDTNGNVYVTGSSANSNVVPYDYDYLTIKLSSAGTPVWTNRYNGPASSDDFPRRLVLDAGGNVYVTGNSTGNGSDYDYATLKYSSAGVPLWTNRYNGPGNGSDFARAVAMDANGNVYVTGYSAGSGSGYDYATIKYAAVPPTPPVITNTLVTGTSLVFAGTGGNVGGTYYVLASTNAAAWMSNWSRLATNMFGDGGNFSVTNAVDSAKGRQFFRLEVP